MRTDIVGFENYYFDMNFNIHSKITGKKMTYHYDKDGYAIVSLRKDSKSYLRKVHRLVALTFIPNPENKPEVNHINGIRNDNRIENLQWVTRIENIRHSFIFGKQCNKGEKHPNSKLKNKDIPLILKMYYFENRSRKEIAEIFNITHYTVTDILNGRTWRHLS